MPDSHLRPPYGLLLFGAFLLLLAVVGICTGEALARFGVVYRAEKPKQFWELIATYLIGGACLIGYFLYKVYGFSH